MWTDSHRTGANPFQLTSVICHIANGLCGQIHTGRERIRDLANIKVGPNGLCGQVEGGRAPNCFPRSSERNSRPDSHRIDRWGVGEPLTALLAPLKEIRDHQIEPNSTIAG